VYSSLPLKKLTAAQPVRKFSEVVVDSKAYSCVHKILPSEHNPEPDKSIQYPDTSTPSKIHSKLSIPMYE
jgi:hypothetical protein